MPLLFYYNYNLKLAQMRTSKVIYILKLFKIAPNSNAFSNIIIPQDDGGNNSSAVTNLIEDM